MSPATKAAGRTPSPHKANTRSRIRRSSQTPPLAAALVLAFGCSSRPGSNRGRLAAWGLMGRGPVRRARSARDSTKPRRQGEGGNRIHPRLRAPLERERGGRRLRRSTRKTRAPPRNPLPSLRREMYRAHWAAKDHPRRGTRRTHTSLPTPRTRDCERRKLPGCLGGRPLCDDHRSPSSRRPLQTCLEIHRPRRPPSSPERFAIEGIESHRQETAPNCMRV